MPTYEYRCDNCRHKFSFVQAMSAGRRKPACPKCKSKQTAQVFSAFYAKTTRKS